jgi:hypothetical protein
MRRHVNHWQKMAERFTMMKVEPGSVGSHADRGFQGRDEEPKEKKKTPHPTRDVACGFNEHGMVGDVQDAFARGWRWL